MPSLRGEEIKGIYQMVMIWLIVKDGLLVFPAKYCCESRHSSHTARWGCSAATMILSSGGMVAGKAGRIFSIIIASGGFSHCAFLFIHIAFSRKGLTTRISRAA